jgi:actin-related protein
VIDDGSHTTKGGLAGSFEPQYVFSSTVAKCEIGKNHTHICVGSKMKSAPKNSVVSKLYDGNHVDWEGVEKMWTHIVREKLAIEEEEDKGECYYMMTEKPKENPKHRTKKTELLFETMKADGIYFGKTTPLGLYAHGLTTGIVIDSGHNGTDITPVFDGYMFPLTAIHLKYSGTTVNEYLRNLISTRPDNPVDLDEKNIEIIKKKYCFVAQDFVDEESAFDQKHIAHVLPDGELLDISTERFRAAEIIFSPGLNASQDEPLPYAVHQSITKSDISLHKLLFQSVCCVGGNTIFNGFCSRLTKDLAHLAPASAKVKIHALPQRNTATWSGGSLLAEQEQMKDIWVTKELYNEMGDNVLAARCF